MKSGLPPLPYPTSTGSGNFKLSPRGCRRARDTPERRIGAECPHETKPRTSYRPVVSGSASAAPPPVRHDCRSVGPDERGNTLEAAHPFEHHLPLITEVEFSGARHQLFG